MELPGFSEARHAVGDADYFVAAGGDGPPVLLLHGFPETHACWHGVAPPLAARARRRGARPARLRRLARAGRRAARRGLHEARDGRGARRAHGALGHERFAVVGHDRGARVAHRLALDHPGRVTRVAVLNTVPTVEQFERMGAGPSLGYWPWFLLAQPAPFPERLLEADPARVLDHVFATWTGDPGAIAPAGARAYRRALDPPTIAAMCADYRASFHVDRVHDADDRDGRAPDRRAAAARHRRGGGPARRRARRLERWAHDVTAATVPGGHFVPEEAPDELLAALAPFLG